jgi:hypothetical protein
MKKFLCFVLLAVQTLFAQAIVFVHSGPTVPTYAIDAIKQARLFNPNTPIYLIANNSALQNLDIPAITVDIESLPYKSTRNRSFSTERFFYIYELMKKFKLRDVIHLQNDNLLYVNIDELLPTFKKYYSNQLGVTFDQDRRAIASLMYIPNPAPLEQFLQFIISDPCQNNKELLARFKNSSHLPIAISKNTPYSTHYDHFQLIFDSLAIGQYLGGRDPIHGPVQPGYIDETSVINPSYFDYEWIRDKEGRKVPYAIYNGEKIKIANLHIHCKDLKKFSSL